MINKKIVAQARLAQRKKGFTLTEIAIVLGIIGLILGAIWTAASGVYNSNRIGAANTELITIAQGTQSLYATQTSFGTPPVNLTPAVAAAGYSPSSMTAPATGVISHPWNGNSGVPSGDGLVFVTAQTLSVAGDAIAVTFANIPAGACVAMLTNASGAAGYYGYTNAKVAAKPSAVPTAPGAIAAGGITQGAITAAAAATACGIAGTNWDTLNLFFTKS
jgi:prepilin-type N-terminal cleavage/methylation domain-containing protein